MKEKLQSLFDSKVSAQPELIELGMHLVYQKAKTVTYFQYPNGEYTRSNRVDFPSKKYNNYEQRLLNSLDKLDTTGLYTMSDLNSGRRTSPGYKRSNTKYRIVKVPYGEDESSIVSKYWNK